MKPETLRATELGLSGCRRAHDQKTCRQAAGRTAHTSVIAVCNGMPKLRKRAASQVVFAAQNQRTSCCPESGSPELQPHPGQARRLLSAGSRWSSASAAARAARAAAAAQRLLQTAAHTCGRRAESRAHCAECGCDVSARHCSGTPSAAVLHGPAQTQPQHWTDNALLGSSNSLIELLALSVAAATHPEVIRCALHHLHESWEYWCRGW